MQKLLMGMLLVAPLWATTIGPDAFGYSASDAGYSLLDIAGTGTRVLSFADDDTAMVNLGFNFSFYGTKYSDACLSMNGVLSFGGCEPSAAPVNLAANTTFNNLAMIAVLWDDWQTYDFTNAMTPDAVYYGTYGVAGAQQFVAEWASVYPSGGADSAVTFTLILDEATGKIQMNFDRVDTGDKHAFGGLATVGIRDVDGEQSSRNLVWAYQSGALAAGSSVVFAPADTAQVPEPPAVDSLLLGALTGLLFVRRGKRGMAAEPK